MKTNSKTSLFLMELIIVILFFSIASVVCVQLFVNAYNTNTQTKESSQATLLIQNLAEGYLGTGGNLNEMLPLYDSAVIEGNSLSLYYDADWNKVSDGSSAAYVARISDSAGASMDEAESAGTIRRAMIEISKKDGTQIASQEISRYEQYRSGDK